MRQLQDTYAGELSRTGAKGPTSPGGSAVMDVLEVCDLSKAYPGFELRGVSLSLAAGRIRCLVGGPGAGKSVTLKSILNLVRPATGRVRCFGLDFRAREQEVKQRMGCVLGDAGCHRSRQIRDIASTTRRFYAGWDDQAWHGYIKRFSLDETKTLSELSEDMRVKLGLAMALSHRAELLILDDPTRGLDPASRDEALGLICDARDGGAAVLLAMRDVSGLGLHADDITCLSAGIIAAEGPLVSLIAEDDCGDPAAALERIMIECERRAFDERLAR